MSFITLDSYYQGSAINTGQGQLGCNTDILDRIKERLDYMIAKHCKVFFMRMDVTAPLNYDSSFVNNAFKNFLQAFLQYARRDKIIETQLVWKKEQLTSSNPHWHLVIFMNGSKTQNIYGHISKAKEIWARFLDIPSAEGYIHYCPKAPARLGELFPKTFGNGIMLQRSKGDFQYRYEYVYWWASYLAKASGSENLASNQRSFGYTQLPS